MMLFDLFLISLGAFLGWMGASVLHARDLRGIAAELATFKQTDEVLRKEIRFLYGEKGAMDDDAGSESQPAASETKEDQTDFRC